MPDEVAVFAAVRAMNRMAGLDLSVSEGARFAALLAEAQRALAHGEAPQALTPDALARRIGVEIAQEECR